MQKTATNFEKSMSFLKSIVGLGYLLTIRRKALNPSSDFLFCSLRSLSTGFKFEIFVYSLGVVYLVCFDRARESRAEGAWVITT